VFIDLIDKHRNLIASRLQRATGVNGVSPEVKTGGLPGLIFSRSEAAMDFQIKLFSWPDRGHHLIIITRGVMDMRGFEQIFREVRTATQLLADCKVVIDLQDTACTLASPDIEAFIAGVELDLWPTTNKVAIVAPQEIEQYHQLFKLTTGLASRGLKVAVFDDSKPAINWLTTTV
jgi:hypothetical protein